MKQTLKDWLSRVLFPKETHEQPRPPEQQEDVPPLMTMQEKYPPLTIPEIEIRIDEQSKHLELMPKMLADRVQALNEEIMRQKDAAYAEIDALKLSIHELIKLKERRLEEQKQKIAKGDSR